MAVRVAVSLCVRLMYLAVSGEAAGLAPVARCHYRYRQHEASVSGKGLCPMCVCVCVVKSFNYNVQLEGALCNVHCVLQLRLPRTKAKLLANRSALNLFVG